jgi:hypothetical protein
MIDEVKLNLSVPVLPLYQIIQLASVCGFNSPESFYSACLKLHDSGFIIFKDEVIFSSKVFLNTRNRESEILRQPFAVVPFGKRKSALLVGRVCCSQVKDLLHKLTD